LLIELTNRRFGDFPIGVVHEREAPGTSGFSIDWKDY
jgi:hypothetical protein